MAAVEAPPEPGIAGPAADPESRSRRGPELTTLFGVAVALVGAGIGARRLSDNSFLTHLATGREMIDGGVVSADRFTWTSSGEPLVVQSWLASLLYGVVDAAAGLGGVRLLMAATAAALTALAWRLTAASASVVVRVALMIPLLYVGLRTWTERPLLLALVLFAATLLIALGEGRPRWLVVVGAVWVNVHGSWPLGLVAVAAGWAGARADRDRGSARRRLEAGRWLALGVAAGGVINPYGPALLVFPVRLLGRSETLSLIAEWKSPDFSTGWSRAFLLLVVVGVVAAVRRARWASVAPMLVFVAAALLSRRNVAVASLAVLPVAAAGLPAFGARLGQRRSDAIRLATTACAVLLVVLPLVAVRAPHARLDRYPVAAIDTMEELGMAPTEVRLVHQDFVGNYLDLRYREPVAWIDDRFELHPPELVDDYVVLLEARSGWSEVLDRWEADAVLWPTDAALVELVREVAGWVTLYEADGWTVMCRPGGPGC